MKNALRNATVAVAALTLTSSLTACGELSTLLKDPASADPLTTSAPASTEMVTEAKDRIISIETIPERPFPGGYERGCKEGEGCVFGPRWSDDYSGPLGHNGCDTRNDVLAQQLNNVEYKGGSGCVVTYGTYTEPYFGTEEEFVKGEPRATQDEVDHVLPLALAWDLGMHTKDLDSRIELANDAEYNLIVTTNAANAGGNDINGNKQYDASLGEYPGKSDMAAYEWLPYLTDTGRACDFSARYVLTADRYGLPVLEADKRAITEAFSRC